MFAIIIFVLLLFYIHTLHRRIKNVEKRLDNSEMSNSIEHLEKSADNKKELTPLEASIFGLQEKEDIKTTVETSHKVPTATSRVQEKSFELQMGVHWFQWLGIAALVAALLFFLKWAFDNNFIGPVGRTAIGYFLSAAAIWFGHSTRKHYGTWALAFTGGGALGAYIVTWIAMAHYNLLTEISAFMVMVLITVVVGLLARVYKSKPLAFFGLLAGFIVPIIAGGYNPWLWLSYVVMLDIAVLVLAHTQKWNFLVIGSYVGTLLWLLISYSGLGYNEDMTRAAFIMFTVLFGIFYMAIPIVYNVRNKQASSNIDIVLIIANALSTFGLLLLALHLKPSVLEVYNGPVAALFAIFFTGYSALMVRDNKTDKPLIYTTVGLALVFAAITIPMQFGTQWTTIMWTLLALLMMWLSVKLKDATLQRFAWPLLIGSFLWFFAIPADFGEVFRSLGAQPLLYTQFGFWWFLVLAAVFTSVSLWWLSLKNRNQYQFLQMSLLVAVFLTGCFVINIMESNQSILNGWQRLIEAAAIIVGSYVVLLQAKKHWSTLTGQQQSAFGMYALALQVFTLGYILYEYVTAIDDDRLFKNANRQYQLEAIGTSIITAFYAAAALVVGLIKNAKSLRQFGVVVLLIALIKLTLVDIASLGTGYRVVGFTILGLLLVGISFLYQHKKDSIKELLV